jgi:hypothetical protein
VGYRRPEIDQSFRHLQQQLTSSTHADALQQFDGHLSFWFLQPHILLSTKLVVVPTANVAFNMGKAPIQPYQPGVYRDDPDRDDAASTSSAVPMDEMDYPEDELPAYTDEPVRPHAHGPSTPQSRAAPGDPVVAWYWLVFTIKSYRTRLTV